MAVTISATESGAANVQRIEVRGIGAPRGNNGEAARRSTYGNSDGKNRSARRHEHRRFAAQTTDDRCGLLQREMLRRHPRLRGIQHGRGDAVASRIVRLHDDRALRCGDRCGSFADLNAINAKHAIEHRARRFNRRSHHRFRGATGREHAAERAERRLLIRCALTITKSIAGCVTGSDRADDRGRSGYRHQAIGARNVGCGVVAAGAGLQEWNAHGCLRRGSRCSLAQHLVGGCCVRASRPELRSPCRLHRPICSEYVTPTSTVLQGGANRFFIGGVWCMGGLGATRRSGARRTGFVTLAACRLRPRPHSTLR